MTYKIIKDNIKGINNDFVPFICKHGTLMVDSANITNNKLNNILIGVYKNGKRYYLEINLETEEIKFKKDNGNYVNSDW